MRASNLSLVIVTGYYLLWTVRAQISQTTEASHEPTNITVSPTTWIANEPFTVNWRDDTANCFIARVNLVEMDLGDVRFVILPSCTNLLDFSSPCTTVPVDSSLQSATGIAPSNLDPAKTYQVDILWATAPNVTNLAQLTHEPVETLVYFASTPSSTSTTGSASSSNNSPVVPIATNLPTTKTAASASTPTASLSPASSTSVPVPSSSDSSSLSTGAKVGIAIGAVGFALLVLIAALLIWRSSRQRQLRALPDGMPYSHDLGSTNRDLTAEKEMNIISSPVDTLNNGYSSIPPVAQTQSRSQTDSWAHPGGHTATGAAVTMAPYRDTHRESYGSGYEDSASPVQDSQAHIPPVAAAGAVIPRKPVGVVGGGPTHHLREPGMSDEEVARLEEEERRLDEAIAEAERKRQLQG